MCVRSTQNMPWSSCLYCSEFSVPCDCFLWVSNHFTEWNNVNTKESIINLPLGIFFLSSAFKLQSILFMPMFKIASWLSLVKVFWTYSRYILLCPTPTHPEFLFQVILHEITHITARTLRCYYIVFFTVFQLYSSSHDKLCCQYAFLSQNKQIAFP